MVATNTRASAWKVGTWHAEAAAWFLAAVLAGCDAWPGGSGLHVEGATPYVRCLADQPPPDGVRRVAAVRIRSRDGAIAIEGLRAPVTIAAFSGPGFAKPLGKLEIEAIAATRPQLLMMLGGIGDTPAIAGATLGALASLSVPTVILAGGRDSQDRIARALEGLKGGADRIINATSARSIRLANDTFVPVSGALDGHYALHASACGYGESDLAGRGTDDASPGTSRRWLLAWQAPAGNGDAAVTHVDEGLDLGSAPLAELARKLGARGGLFAWPEVQVLRPSAAGGHARAAFGVPYPDLQLVVPRLTGPAIERSDGSRVAPGFALLRLDAKGLSLVSAHAFR